VKANVSDGVVDLYCTRDLSNGVMKETYMFPYATVLVTRSSCPIVSDPLDVLVVPKEGSSNQQVVSNVGELVSQLYSRTYIYNRK